MPIPQEERVARVRSTLLGALLAAVAFVVVFAFLARFEPAFVRFTESRWRGLLPVLASLVVPASGWIQWRRRSKLNREEPTAIRRGARP